MYHVHYRGAHYEAGFRWGAFLLKRKNKILDHVPFAVNLLNLTGKNKRVVFHAYEQGELLSRS